MEALTCASNSIGWLAALTHSAYWLSLMARINQIPPKDQPRTGQEIWDLRLLHFGLMGFGCLVFTLLSFAVACFVSHCQKQQRSSQGEVSNGQNSGPTSYQQHSSSAEERKYMQQQLQQFNTQTRPYTQLESGKMMMEDQSEEAKAHEMLQQNSKLEMNSSNSNSKFVNKSGDNTQQKQQRTQKHQSQQSQQLGKSSIIFNGQMFFSRDDRHLSPLVKGGTLFPWSLLCTDSRSMLIFFLSIVMNIATQAILAAVTDDIINTNILPAVRDSSFDEDVLCFSAAHSFSIILLVFSMLHQFICLPSADSQSQNGGSKPQPEENLAQGIYLTFVAIAAFLFTTMVVKLNSWTSLLACLAFLLMGLRMLMLKLFVQNCSLQISCFFINLVHLWGELVLSAFVYIYFSYDTLAATSPELLVFSRYDLIDESMHAALYVFSLVLVNASITNSSLFSFTNQFMLASSVIMFFNFLSYYLTFFLVAKFFAVIALFIVLNFAYKGIKGLILERLEANQQKKQQYGNQFNDDQYERLIPSAIIGGQDTDSMNKSDHELMLRNNQPPYRSNFEYYIVENEVSLLLKKRPCLDKHYKFNSIQHFALRFYSINSIDLSQSQDTNQLLDRQDEQRLFLKAIENYQRKMFS